MIERKAMNVRNLFGERFVIIAQRDPCLIGSRVTCVPFRIQQERGAKSGG